MTEKEEGLERAEEEARSFREKFQRLEEEVRKVIVGQESVVREVLVAILAGGHTLLEGVPGLGKTLLCRTLAASLDLEFRRIQFTPDLMPADILGTNVVHDTPEGRKRFEFQQGPVFGNIILADEINRATPKTQSALLEAMQESTVTVAGERRPLPDPFFVLATQNPIEMEGTYPLPEAQVDRFLLKVDVTTQNLDALVEVLERTTGGKTPVASPVLKAEELRQMRAVARDVLVAPSMLRYAASLCLASHPGDERAPELARRYVRYGASPRGAQALVLSSKVLALTRGRCHVDPADIRAVAPAALRHRILLNFEGEAEGITSESVIAEILEEVSPTEAEVKKLLGS